MNFDFNQDQQELRQSLRKFMQEQAPLSSARLVLENQTSHDNALWQALVELGVTGGMLPDNAGGNGLGALEMCIVAEEAGRQLAPAPLSSSLYLSAQLLLGCQDTHERNQLLTRISQGEIATLAAPLDQDDSNIDIATLPEFRNDSLYGEVVLVADPLSATLALVLARDINQQPLWVSCELEHQDTSQLTRTGKTTLYDIRPQGALNFNGAEATPVTQDGCPLTLLTNVRHRAAILLAFEQLGAAESITEMAVEHAKERRSFGRAIGSYQGIKHKLTDMYTLNQMARAHCYFGAWALDLETRMDTDTQTAGEIKLAAASARVAATRALNYAAQEAIQVHGGMGYTWELDCHLFYRAARYYGLLLGSEMRWTDTVADELQTRFMTDAA